MGAVFWSLTGLRFGRLLFFYDADAREVIPTLLPRSVCEGKAEIDTVLLYLCIPCITRNTYDTIGLFTSIVISHKAIVAYRHVSHVHVQIAHLRAPSANDLSLCFIRTSAIPKPLSWPAVFAGSAAALSRRIRWPRRPLWHELSTTSTTLRTIPYATVS